MVLKTIVRTEFKKNMNITDTSAIETLKSNAVRGLANYMMIESSTKDERLQKHASAFVQKEVDSIQSDK